MLDSLCWSTCVAGPEGLQLYEKETPTQLFPCEYCEIFKIFFFILRTSGDCFMEVFDYDDRIESVKRKNQDKTIFLCFSTKVTFMWIEKFDEICNHISRATKLIVIESLIL